MSSSVFIPHLDIIPKHGGIKIGNEGYRDICLQIIIVFFRTQYDQIDAGIVQAQRLHPFKIYSWGFPGGSVVENLPANAGDTGSSPGLGRSHMPRSGWAREPQLRSLRVWSLCSATREAAIVRGPHTAMKSGPRLLQVEKALAQKRRPDTAKNK